MFKLTGSPHLKPLPSLEAGPAVPIPSSQRPASPAEGKAPSGPSLAQRRPSAAQGLAVALPHSTFHRVVHPDPTPRPEGKGFPMAQARPEPAPSASGAGAGTPGAAGEVSVQWPDEEVYVPLAPSHRREPTPDLDEPVEAFSPSQAREAAVGVLRLHQIALGDLDLERSSDRRAFAREVLQPDSSRRNDERADLLHAVVLWNDPEQFEAIQEELLAEVDACALPAADRNAIRHAVENPLG